MENQLEYERDLFIDESSLDVECLNQAPLMMRYSRALASAERECARLKEKIGVERAALDKDIRTSPEKHGLRKIKITEAVVNNAILTNKKFQSLTNELIDAQYEASMCKGAVDSVRQRKDMLQELVKLHGQQYFAGPSVPRDLTAEARKTITKTQSNDTIKITRKKR